MFSYLLCCWRRYGSCGPLSEIMTSNGIPCQYSYDTQNDYVYLRNSLESFHFLNAIAQYEFNLRFEDGIFDISDCLYPTLRMICHLFLPRCGNSTHFELPTSLCSDACHQQSLICSARWEHYKSHLNNPDSSLNCSTTETTVPFSCSDSGVYSRKL